MRITRRSADMNTNSIHDPPRKRNNYLPMDTISKGNLATRCIGQVSSDLLNTCFSIIRPNIWYSVIPLDNETSDISSGIRQKWEDILPLLIHTGLIKKNSLSCNGFDVFQPKWHEFVQNFPGSEKLHFTNFRKKGEELRYYVCLGKPTFHNYTKQNNAIQRKSFAFEQLFYMNTADRELRQIMNNHIFKLKDMFNNMTITQDTPEYTIPDPDNEIQSTADTPVIPPPTVTPVVSTPSIVSPELAPVTSPQVTTPHPAVIPTPSSVSPTHPEVKFAMLLDFETATRIHRSGDGLIPIHKRIQPSELEQVIIFLTMNRWGYTNDQLTYKQRKLIQSAACRLTAYDYGYAKPFGTTQI